MRTRKEVVNAIKARNVDELYRLLAGQTELYITSDELSEAKDIGDEGAKIIAQAWAKGLALTDIALWNTGVSDEGAAALANVLRGDHKLKLLCFSYDRIGDAGARALADALKTNDTLEVLDLGANERITDGGAQAIAEMLPQNSRLKFIHLGCSRITRNVVPAFVAALEKNHCLTALQLAANIEEILLKPIPSLLKRNEAEQTRREAETKARAEAQQGKATSMKVQNWGSSARGPLTHAGSNEWYDAGNFVRRLLHGIDVGEFVSWGWGRELDGCIGYRNARGNGTEKDSPSRSFPHDGLYTWLTPDDAIPCCIRYTEGAGDKVWMEERDWNYIRRLLSEGRLLELAPNADKEIVPDHKFRVEIAHALEAARAGCRSIEELEAKRQAEADVLPRMKNSNIGVSKHKRYEHFVCIEWKELFHGVDCARFQSWGLSPNARGGVNEYRSARENGCPEDTPKRLFPCDGIFTWDTPDATMSYIRYTAGPGDRAWMEERDRNYLARLARGDIRNEQERQDYLTYGAPKTPTPTAPVSPPPPISPEHPTPPLPPAPPAPEVRDPIPVMHIDYEIPYSQLTLGAEIGRGGFGVVYQGSYHGASVAIKQLHLVEVSPRTMGEFQKEAALMVSLRHPNIVTVFGVCTERGHYSVVMDYMPRGSLDKVLYSDLPLSWTERANIALDIGRGVSFLHSHHIIHRDLKSLNVLLEEREGGLHAKITDFGLARVKTETQTAIRTGTIHVEGRGGEHRSVGTLHWLAPELLSLNPAYTEASDIYALAMVLLEIAARKVPFEDVADTSIIRDAVRAGERPEIPAECPSGYAAIISRCWAQRREERPKIEEVVRDLEGCKASLQ